MSVTTDRNRLERRRDDLRRLLSNYQRDLRAASSADFADMAQEKEDDEVLEELEVSALREIEQIDAAQAIATGNDARLIGLHVVPGLPPGLGFGLRNAHEPLIEVRQRYNAAALERADGVRRAFETHLQDRASKPEWQFVFGAIDATVAHYARSADITVAGPVGPGARPERAAVDLPAQIALAAGQPVLAIPSHARIDTVGRCVLVCWNGSREAARAAGDALPILGRAERVIALHVEEAGRELLPLAGLTAHLAGHGVAVETDETTSRSSVDYTILNRAANRSADLIVMGAYGRSRLRETVLGGTTRDVLRLTTVSVLLAH